MFHFRHCLRQSPHLVEAESRTVIDVSSIKFKIKLYFEIKLYSVSIFKYGELLAEYIKENWNSSLDDCYTVSRSSQINPEELLLTLNSINPSIQFFVKYSKDQILFLGVLIKRDENGI